MPTSNPTVRRRRLGLILRELRGKAGLTCEAVAQELERSDSWVSRIETGRTGLRSRDLNDLLDLYRLTDQVTRTELARLAKESRERGWWNRYGATVTGPYASYISFEHEASGLLCFDSLVVNGLLQTEAYARALHRHAVSTQVGEDESHVSRKLTRQRRLTDESPLALWAILDESVLRRSFGGPTVMRGQLQHLLDLIRELPHLSVQVLPLDQPVFAGMHGAFSIIEFPPPDTRIVFTEGMHGMAMEEDPDAQRYSQIFDELRSAALSKNQSRQLIESVRNELTT